MTVTPDNDNDPKQAAMARLRKALRNLNAAAEEQAREFRSLRGNMADLSTAMDRLEGATLEADAKLQGIGEAARERSRRPLPES